MVALLLVITVVMFVGT